MEVLLKNKYDSQKIPLGLGILGALDITMGALGLLSFGVAAYAFIYWVGCTMTSDLSCVGVSGVTCVASLCLLGFPLSPAIILGRFILRLSVLARVFQFIYSTLLILYFLLVFFIIRPNGNFNFWLLLPCGVSFYSIGYLLKPRIKELFNEPLLPPATKPGKSQ